MNRQQIVLDSSVWIALISDQDSQHKKAIDVFYELDPNEIYIFDYIYIETLTVLRLKVSSEVCRKFIDLLKEYDFSIDFSDENALLNASKELINNKIKLSFVDSFLIALNKKGFKVVTFDKDLAKCLK